MKSKVAKHTMFGPLLEGETSNKCTPLWRQAHFQVDNVKKLSVSDNLDVEKVDAVVPRSTFGNCGVGALPIHTYVTLHYIRLHDMT